MTENNNNEVEVPKSLLLKIKVLAYTFQTISCCIVIVFLLKALGIALPAALGTIAIACVWLATVASIIAFAIMCVGYLMNISVASDLFSDPTFRGMKREKDEFYKKVYAPLKLSLTMFSKGMWFAVPAHVLVVFSAAQLGMVVLLMFIIVALLLRYTYVLVLLPVFIKTYAPEKTGHGVETTDVEYKIVK